MDFHYETKQLCLKVLDTSYAAVVCDFYKRNKTTFEAVEPPRIPNFYTVEFQKGTLFQEYNEFLLKNYLRLYLFRKGDPFTIVGSICFNSFKSGCFQSCMLGYKTDYYYSNRGYMSEALDYAIHFILSKNYQIHRIEAMVLPDNYASLHLLEKLGFQNEGVSREYAKLNGIWRDHFRYSLLLYQ